MLFIKAVWPINFPAGDSFISNKISPSWIFEKSTEVYCGSRLKKDCFVVDSSLMELFKM